PASTIGSADSCEQPAPQRTARTTSRTAILIMRAPGVSSLTIVRRGRFGNRRLNQPLTITPPNPSGGTAAHREASQRTAQGSRPCPPPRPRLPPPPPRPPAPPPLPRASATLPATSIPS